MPTLHVLQGSDEGRTYRTSDEPAVIGRLSGQVRLSDNSASRRHAEIRPVNGTWFLLDLNSSNGTFLNGRRVTSPTAIKDGDKIKVGNSVLVFSARDGIDRFIGTQRIQDRVGLELCSPPAGPSTPASVDASEESVILQPPETADAVAAWNVVYRVAETIGRGDSAEVFLEHVTDIIFDHLAVDRAVALIRTGDDGKLVPQVVRWRTREGDTQPEVAASRTIIDHVIRTRDGVLCANAMTDDRFRTEADPDSIHDLGLRSVICVPIVARDEVHGVFHFDCSMSYHTFTQEQLRLAVAIGRLVGLAFENARLLESRVRTERLAAIGETVAYLSHHIRNILQGLQGGADVVEMGFRKGDTEATTVGWSLVRRNLERIYQLTLNMLTFSKKRQPLVETAQLNTIVQDVISLAQTRADERSVTVVSELGKIPAIPLDSDGMHQVVHNIVLNAIDAAPTSSGRIHLKTSLDDDARYVVLSITDNGPGIPPDAADSIFDAFQSSKGQAGTGLGLAAAKKIVDELSGSIEVDSTPGEGTTFHIKLLAERTHVDHGGRTKPA